MNGGFSTFGNLPDTITEDATNSVAVLSSDDSGASGGIVSNSSLDTGKEITVTWDIASVNGDVFVGNSEGYRVGIADDQSGSFDLSIFVDWGRELEISADGQTIVLADQGTAAKWVQATLDSTKFLFEFDQGSSVSGSWADFGVNYANLSDASGQSYVLASLQDRGGKGGTDPTVKFDSIEVTTIPEPASFLLLVLGGTFILRRPRRR